MKILISSNRTILYSLLCLCLLSFSSCNDDFLDEHAVSNISADFVYSTEEGLKSAVVALYDINRSLHQDGEWNNAMALLLPAEADLALVRTGEISLYGTRVWGASLADYGTTRLDKWWKTYYKIVLRANAIIKAVPNVEMDEASKNQILAETKTWRAYAYFTLYRLFNNIYITTEPTTPENAFDVINKISTKEEIFKLINSDLDFAIAHLSWTTAQFGRITQGVARTIRAKTALWQKNWEEARKQTDAIIEDGPYSLVSTADVFKGDLNNSETIWAIQFADQTPGGGNKNHINFNYIPQYTKETGNNFDINMGGFGAGFVLMNKYLINLFNDPNDTRTKGTYYIMNYTYNNPSSLPAGAHVGDTIRLWSENSTDPDERYKYYERLNPATLKYVQNDADPTLASMIKNIMVYRLAGTYLMSAEAYMELGNTGKALQRINKVRDRAHAAPLTTITQKILLEERARELAFEGQRWFTLKRMGLLYDYITDHAGTENDNGVLFQAQARDRFKKYMVNWPIPVAEMNLLGPDYPQNTGY